MQGSQPPAASAAAVLLLALLLVAPPAAAHEPGGDPGTGGPWQPRAPSEDVEIPRGEEPCPDENPGWREAQTVVGVEVQEAPLCSPDNPELVAAFTKGTNNVPQTKLDQLKLHEDAVTKCCDEDGDGDPDRVNLTLEVSEVNGWHLEDDPLVEPFEIAPGVAPSFWVFSPKTTIAHEGPEFRDLVRPPSPPLRVEQGDQVNLTLENTHYFPHTIHLHGVDHPFVDASGEGNDGVPRVSEAPLEPGHERAYEFQARQPGTMFYHCHVQPDVHVLMGLSGALIVEEDRTNNSLQTVNPGAGLVRNPSEAVAEDHDREYDLQYQAVDEELHAIPQEENDPRVVAREMQREYDPAERDPEYFLLNGRSFPYTLRESVVAVEPDERVKLRVLDAGSEPVSLHTHGHKPTVTHTDGVEVPEAARTQRDVHDLHAAQRLDMTLNTTDNGLDAYGSGLWFLHDHREEAVTTDGIGPGGDISLIAYEEHLDDETRMPEPNGGSWDILFTEAYYQGEIPVWHDLGLPRFLGDVAQGAQAQSADEDRGLPGPGVASLVAAAGLAVLLRRGVEP
jgi:hypothetical protein